jgi:putative copper export protein
MYAWLRHVAPNGNFSGAVFTASVSSGVGRWELARVLFAVLMLWAIALARSERIALSFGVLCLLASGAVGHPAAIMPAWTVPAKMAHLVAGAVWFGGLLWLLRTYRRNPEALARESQRVSKAALYSLLLILLSGIIQIRFFINMPSELLVSYYGRLALAKIAGFVILLGYGGFNRYRAMPALVSDQTGNSLKRSVSQEIVVMAALILIGGLLAYVPTPAVVPAAQATGKTQ